MLLTFRAVWSRGAVWPSTRPCQGRDRRFESGRDRHLTCSRLERWPSPVEGDGLENRYRGNPIVGSNPTLSARFVFENWVLVVRRHAQGCLPLALSCAICVPTSDSADYLYKPALKVGTLLLNESGVPLRSLVRG